VRYLTRPLERPLVPGGPSGALLDEGGDKRRALSLVARLQPAPGASVAILVEPYVAVPVRVVGETPEGAVARSRPAPDRQEQGHNPAAHLTGHPVERHPAAAPGRALDGGRIPIELVALPQRLNDPSLGMRLEFSSAGCA
jgi:hypothetical protein